MKELLPWIFALGSVAAAQTLTGLPQYGITIFGGPLQITNQGTKAIFCVVVRSESSGKPLGTGATWFANNPIPPDSTAHPLQFAIVNGAPGSQPPDKIYVDGVIFEDGTFVGPDNGNSFPSLSRAIAAYVATGTLLQTATDKAAVWSQLESLRAARGTPQGSREADGEAFAKKGSAISLINARVRYGDDAALALAAKFVALGNLHKDN